MGSMARLEIPKDAAACCLAKCWRIPWSLSMVADQSQSGLYVHRIAARADTVEILWKLGCGPLKSYRRGDACAWTGCLQLMMRSKRPKNAHTCVLVLLVEMAVNSLAFSVENPW
uniref:Uncharacterized protein n=1 Tax=Vitis vinifera TaxID=29760 RepID=A5ADX3_VITVI|nr:hypothetical protein VITISV_028574 [Vitis vinifera]